MTILKYSGSGVAAAKIEVAHERDQIAHSHRHSWKRPRPSQANNRSPPWSAATIQERELKTKLVATSNGSDNASLPTTKLPNVDTLPMKGAQQRAGAKFSWKRPRDENSSISYDAAFVATIPAVPSTTVENITGPTRVSQASRQAQKSNAPTKGASRSWKRPREENSVVSSEYPSEKAAGSSPASVNERRMAPTSAPHPSLQAVLSQPALAALTGEATLHKVGHGKLVRKVAKAGQDAVVKHSVTRSAHQHHSVAKRIQLDSHDNTQNGIETSEPNDNVDSSVRLTDHAYRSRQKSAARSLVRVPVDETTTRICPTVFQGRPCTDTNCRKRHDVAQEFTVPICTFFQRPGLGCRAGDACPFRHVKVTSRAAVCPNFARLGFCQDATCKLAHMSK
jgi:hypothetical protein